MRTVDDRSGAARGALASLQRADALLLLLLLAFVLCGWTFVAIAHGVTGERVQSFDDRFIRSLRQPDDPSVPKGPDWLEDVMRDLTALGSASVLVLYVLGVAGFLWVRRQYHALALVLGATISGRLLNELLKVLFARPRPDHALWLTRVQSPSFPSGHAMDSAVVYLTLAAMLARLVQPRALKLYFLALAGLMSFLVGVSRVYLGVHYPTDVLAGWTAGLAWAVLCWLVASYLQKRGSVEGAK
jgi:undecaprenyl-diphosphatase